MYENVEIIIEINVKTMKVHNMASPTLSLSRIKFTQSKEEFETAMSQKQAMTTRTRHKVTTYLYLMPNSKARSLSTLMAADVRGDTASNTL